MAILQGPADVTRRRHDCIRDSSHRKAHDEGVQVELMLIDPRTETLHLVHRLSRLSSVDLAGVHVSWHPCVVSGPAFHAHLNHEGRKFLPIQRTVVVSVHLRAHEGLRPIRSGDRG